MLFSFKNTLPPSHIKVDLLEFQYLYNDDFKISNCSTHPHNIFFQLLSETGFIGIIIYLILFILLIKEVIKFLINKNINQPKIFFILPTIYYLNPLFPSGNFFNNWYMFIGIMGLPFYLFLSKSKKSV